ncbi:hypothetical protein H4Q26_007824 [Puccinia striiformis f. sp. tritici PST-130]|nr:hypothetical protein H4Q26_007824 [Puccinia striiformis f. sp. tritici PST-130]
MQSQASQGHHRPRHWGLSQVCAEYLGACVNSYVTEFQTKSILFELGAGKIDTVQVDMKKFFLVGELSRLVSQLKLLKNVRELIASPSFNKDNKITLLLLYALRYQQFNRNDTLSIIQLLKEYLIPEEDTKLIYILPNFSGYLYKRQTDLFNNSNFSVEVFKSVLKRLKGVENVYTQRNPQLIETVELLLKGKLKEIRHVSITLKCLCSNNGGTVGLGTLNNNNVANGFEEFGDAAVDGVCNLLGRVRKGIVRGFRFISHFLPSPHLFPLWKKR